MLFCKLKYLISTKICFLVVTTLLISINSKSQTSKVYPMYGYFMTDKRDQQEYFVMTLDKGVYVTTNNKRLVFSLSNKTFKTKILKEISEDNTTTYIGESFTYTKLYKKDYDALTIQTGNTFNIYFLIKKIPNTDAEKKILNEDVRNQYHNLKLQQY